MTQYPVYVNVNDTDGRPEKLGAYNSSNPISTAYGGTGTNNFSGAVASIANTQASSVTQNYIDVCSLGSGGATAFSALTDTNIGTPITGQVVTWDGTDWTPSTSPTGVTAHNLLTGLSANDHPQYVLSATNLALSTIVGGLETNIADIESDLIALTNDYNAHEASATVHYAMSAIDHGTIAGLGDNDHPQYVLSATNLALSTLVTNLQTSTSELSAYIDANEAAWLAGGGATDHGALTGLADNDHPQYVLSATNLALSTLTSNIQTSTVDLSAYIAANQAAWATDTNTTDHGALTGLADNDHPQYVLVTTNTNLSSTVSNHLASSVHWDIATLNTNYLNASGDSANASFFLQNLSSTQFSATSVSSLHLSSTNISATNYSGISLSGSLRDVGITSPGSNNVLAWNGTTWQASAISFPGGGGGLTEGQVQQLILDSIASGITTSGIDVVNSSPTDSVTIGSQVNVLIDRERITIGDMPIPAPFVYAQLATSADYRTTGLHSWASGATVTLLSSIAPNGDNYFTFDNANTEKSVTVIQAGVYKIDCNFVLGTSASVSPTVSGIISIGAIDVVSSLHALNQAAQPVTMLMTTVQTLAANDIIRPKIRSSSANRHYLFPKVTNLYIERKF